MYIFLILSKWSTFCVKIDKKSCILLPVTSALSYFIAFHMVSSFSINSPGLCDLCIVWKSVQAAGFTPLLVGEWRGRKCVCSIEQSFDLVNVNSITPTGKVGRKVSKRMGY